jgi:hypothetical protein
MNEGSHCLVTLSRNVQRKCGKTLVEGSQWFPSTEILDVISRRITVNCFPMALFTKKGSLFARSNEMSYPTKPRR